ncbi:MAG: hypothetical protein ABI616_01285 [Pseudomonadota bacterium]
MDSSESLLTATARNGSGEIADAASLLLGDVGTWRTWESEFGSSLRAVTLPWRLEEQVRALRLVGFSSIHRATPFRHIRDRRLRGHNRRRVISGLHNRQSYARAMIAEHRNYIRNTCSLVCSAHIGESIFGDSIFSQSVSRYQGLYADYFQVYCAVNFLDEAEAAAQQALLPLLRLQVDELRNAILDYPKRATWLLGEIDIRKPVGDTQRLPRLNRHVP